MLEALIFALLEGLILLFGIALVLVVLIVGTFIIVCPLVLLADFLYGLLKRRWYRMYFDLTPLPRWKSNFIYKRLFRTRWFM